MKKIIFPYTYEGDFIKRGGKWINKQICLLLGAESVWERDREITNLFHWVFLKFSGGYSFPGFLQVFLKFYENLS